MKAQGWSMDEVQLSSAPSKRAFTVAGCPKKPYFGGGCGCTNTPYDTGGGGGGGTANSCTKEGVKYVSNYCKMDPEPSLTLFANSPSLRMNLTLPDG